MIGSAFLSAFQTINSKLNRRTAKTPAIPLDDIVGEIFRGIFNRDPDPVGKTTYRTHTPQIDRGLIGLFATHGWVLEGAEDCYYDSGIFHDGTQVWRNPLLSV